MVHMLVKVQNQYEAGWLSEYTDRHPNQPTYSTKSNKNYIIFNKMVRDILWSADKRQ